MFYYSIVCLLLKTKKEKEKEKLFNQSTSRAGRNKVLCELCQRGRYAQENSRPQIRHSCIHIHVAIYLLQPKWYQNLAVIIEQKSQKNIARASMKGSYVKYVWPNQISGGDKSGRLPRVTWPLLEPNLLNLKRVHTRW